MSWVGPWEILTWMAWSECKRLQVWDPKSAKSILKQYTIMLKIECFSLCTLIFLVKDSHGPFPTNQQHGPRLILEWCLIYCFLIIYYMLIQDKICYRFFIESCWYIHYILIQDKICHGFFIDLAAMKDKSILIIETRSLEHINLWFLYWIVFFFSFLITWKLLFCYQSCCIKHNR